MLAFSAGDIRCLVTKPTIAGHGLNWQHCADMAFVGLSDSYEQFYQAVRRCWRFGQKQTVNVHVICAETEGAVVANIKRKEREALEMAENMVEHMKDLNAEALHGATIRSKTEYARDVKSGDGWTLHLADCVDVVAEQPDDERRLLDLLAAVRQPLHLLQQRPRYGELHRYRTVHGVVSLHRQ